MELALRHEPVHEQTHGEFVQILERGVVLVEEAIVTSLLSHNTLPEGTLLGQNGSLDIELSLGLADIDGSPVMARCVDCKVVGLNPVDRCRQGGVLGLGLHVAWRKRDETGTGCRGHGGVDRRAGRCHWSWGTWCRGRGWSWCGSGGSYASVRLRVASGTAVRDQIVLVINGPTDGGRRSGPGEGLTWGLRACSWNVQAGGSTLRC